MPFTCGEGHVYLQLRVVEIAGYFAMTRFRPRFSTAPRRRTHGFRMLILNSWNREPGGSARSSDPVRVRHYQWLAKAVLPALGGREVDQATRKLANEGRWARLRGVVAEELRETIASSCVGPLYYPLEDAMVPLMIGMAAPVFAVIAYALLTDTAAERDEEQ